MKYFILLFLFLSPAAFANHYTHCTKHIQLTEIGSNKTYQVCEKEWLLIAPKFFDVHCDKGVTTYTEKKYGLSTLRSDVRCWKS